MIRTVNGDIPEKSLEWCQCHEHIFIRRGKSALINPSLCMDDYRKSVEEVTAYYVAGGRALIDCQPGGFGRMESELIHLGNECGVHIICTTGFHKQIFLEGNNPIGLMTVDELSEYFCKEITDCIYDLKRPSDVFAGHRAGIIKIALDKDGIQKNILSERLFEAATNASKETGATLLCHIDSDCDVPALMRYISGYGISLNRLILCHMDRTHNDIGIHREIVQAGAYLEYDTINRMKYHSNEYEVSLFSSMIDAGYGTHLLAGLDTTNQRLRAYGANMGLDFILKEFVPMLLCAGISQRTINTIMIDNPRKALSIVTA